MTASSMRPALARTQSPIRLKGFVPQTFPVTRSFPLAIPNTEGMILNALGFKPGCQAWIHRVGSGVE